MISDEAVEAAAKAVWENVEVIQTREYAEEIARLALEAAAPHMHDKAAETRLMAIVWTEAYQAGFQEGAGFGPTPNPYRPQS